MRTDSYWILDDSIVGSMEAPSKAFLLFFLLPDWLKLSHLKSRTECGFQTFFSRHICSTVAETIGVANYAELETDCWNTHKETFWEQNQNFLPVHRANFPVFLQVSAVVLGIDISALEALSGKVLMIRKLALNI